jgi:hypothetical protein
MSWGKQVEVLCHWRHECFCWTIRDGLSSSQAGIQRHLVMAKLVDRIFHRVRQHPFRQTAGVQLLQNLRKILRHLKMI